MALCIVGRGIVASDILISISPLLENQLSEVCITEGLRVKSKPLHVVYLFMGIILHGKQDA